LLEVGDNIITKIKLILLVIFASIGSSIVFSFQAIPNSIDKLKQINVLEDSQDDIRKQLGEPVETDKFADYYSFDDGGLMVIYSQGKCVQTLNAGKWNVSKDVVIKAEFNPDDDIEFDSLKLNLKDFKIIQTDDDVPSINVYRNEKAGIEYVRQTTPKTDGISDIRIFPPKSKLSLRCK